jgi:hypothetical protein
LPLCAAPPARVDPARRSGWAPAPRRCAGGDGHLARVRVRVRVRVRGRVRVRVRVRVGARVRVRVEG